EVDRLDRIASRLEQVGASLQHLTALLEVAVKGKFLPMPSAWGSSPLLVEFRFTPPDLPWVAASFVQAKARGERVETPVREWTHLVRRKHPWRQQLYVKGRNVTVGQLLSTVKANGLTPEQAAEELDLPLGAIVEALAYAEQNRELLEFEAAYERLLLASKG